MEKSLIALFFIEWAIYQIAQIGLKIDLSPYFWGDTSSSDTPCTNPTCAKVLLVLHLGTFPPPCYKKNPRSAPAIQASAGLQERNFRVPNWGGGVVKATFFNFAAGHQN